jgi:transposase
MPAMSERPEIVRGMPDKRYRPWTPHQSYLLPPSPLEWLPENHLAYFVLEVVQTLDVSGIEQRIRRKDARGTRPYPPAMMVALLLYAYCTGVFSSRKIARATHDIVAFRVLAGGAHPHFTTINEFRLTHHEALAELFVQGLSLCKKAGLVTVGHVALDGSKIQANASKHKAMSYERMQSDEARLRREIEALLARAEATDRAEDGRYGPGQDIEDLPVELARREQRLARLREAKAALEREATQARAKVLRENAVRQRDKAADAAVDDAERQRAARRAEASEQRAQALDPHDDNDDSPAADGGASSDDLPHHRVPTTPDGTPAPAAQRNFTDPDSRIMKNNTGYLQAYNAQAAVDGTSQVIVACALTNQAPDPEHLPPMLDRIEANCGATPERLSADSGYFSADNVDACEQRGVDAYLAVGRERHAAGASARQRNESATRAQQAKQRMRDKLATPSGKAIYARRKTIAEPPFGQIKEARGFRRFSLRGLAKARSEWAFVCLTHNLLKLYRATWPATSTGYAAHAAPAT